MKYTAVDVDEVLRETNAAFLFMIEDVERWVPKSTMENPACASVGETEIVVDIATWFVRKWDDE